MRELILLRHAHAEPADNGLADIDRPLSPHGLAEAEAAGRWLLEQRLVPDRVLCSPAPGWACVHGRTLARGRGQGLNTCGGCVADCC